MKIAYLHSVPISCIRFIICPDSYFRRSTWTSQSRCLALLQSLKASPYGCHPGRWSQGSDLRGRRGTAGWGAQPEAGSQMLPYRHRILSQSTWFYLEDTHTYTISWAYTLLPSLLCGEDWFLSSAALTLLFEGEVLCEMSALVVPSEEEQGVGVVDLQSPQVQYTLQTHTHKYNVILTLQLNLTFIRWREWSLSPESKGCYLMNIWWITGQRF